MTGRLSRILIPTVALVALVGGLAAIKFKQVSLLIHAGEEMEKAGAPPETVSTAVVKREKWEATLTAVGSVTAAKGVALSNDAAGVVTRLHFDSGQTVRAGQVLVELDASVERAQLKSAESRLELATSTAARSRALAGKGSLSAAELERDVSAEKTASTEIETLRAQIARKTVRAPFDGKLGIRNVNVGQYLQPGTTLTVLESAGGLHVDFTLPQQRLPDVHLGMPVRAVVSGSGTETEGTLTAIDPSVDATTRTVKLQATLPNLKDELRPGMFVNVAVVLPERAEQLVVPLTAIVRAPYGDSLFVVEGDKVRQQFVRLGETRGDFVAVEEGVKDGETVVRAGAFKLRNGSKIVVNNEVGPTPELNPKLENH
ncbi:MAG: efflux RND transporter periplasmic adaptor subunit [Labilithrix sp.]|nr:efflux RND transporter periplasmic adaptor subunit [Labilithrix sp.]MCW5833777.1 efflux RND transporter periplasmic adaptor subunit [Labilithrix sp.]